MGGLGGVDTPAPVAYEGVDRGFIFFEESVGTPWRGIVDIEVSEDSYLIDTYYMEGRKIGHRHRQGNYRASVTSYDDPFTDIDMELVSGFTYRESYTLNGKQEYRLHLVHGASIRHISTEHHLYNVSDPKDASTYKWVVDSIDVELREDTGLQGSHLILDSAATYDWSMRDIETILYEDGRIPSIDEMFDIFSEMNFVIIDHGDGTWSAVGHESMIRMLDVTEFMIQSPSVEIDESDPYTYDVYDYIRDERWLE